MSNLIEGLFVRYLAHSSPALLINYCRENGRIKQIEDQIVDNPDLACYYAEEVIKDRWPEAEKNISESDRAIRYAQKVIKDRFPLYEKRIIKDRTKIIQYCKSINKRFPEAEPCVAKGAFSDILEYAKFVIKDRFELAEQKIMTKPKWILDYAIALGRKPSEEMHSAMIMFSFQDPANKVIKEYLTRFK